MSTYGYARVSTDGQTLDAQQATLKAAGAEKVFSEKQSGAKTSTPSTRRGADIGNHLRPRLLRPRRERPRRRAAEPSRRRIGHPSCRFIGTLSGRIGRVGEAGIACR
jgi:hypothetical protein